MLMFADNIFCAKSDNNLKNLIQYVNGEINKMAVWFRANKLAVNVSKTKYMIFHTNSKKIDENLPHLIYDENELNEIPNPNLINTLERYHNNHPDKKCRAYKLLGIFLDENLNLNSHVTHLCNKLARSVYCIRQAKAILSTPALKSLYYALIHSHLTYCPIIISITNTKNRKRIETVQKKAIRLISKSRYNAHTGPLFKQHNILSHDKIILQSKLHLMHAVEYNYAPPPLVIFGLKMQQDMLNIT